MSGPLLNEKYSRYYQRLGLMYQKPEFKVSLEVILSVFMVTILIFVAIKPTLSNVAGLQKKIADQELMNTKADKKIGQLLEAQTQMENYQDKLSLFEKSVGNRFSYFDMMSRIEVLASKNSLNIESVTAPGTKIKGGTTGTGGWSTKLIKINPDGSLVAEVNLTILGSSANLRRFLADVENMDVLTMIKNIGFVKEVGGVRGAQKLKVAVVIQFYFLPSSNET